jgi:hypothetical protein
MARTWPLLFLTFFNFLKKYLRTHNNSTLIDDPHRKWGENNPSTRKPEGIARIDGGSPELALGADLVGGPELHAVDLGVLIAGRRERAPHHLVLMELHTCESRQRINPMDQILITEVRETKREKTHPEGHHFR